MSSKTHKSRVNEWCQRHPDLGKPQYSTEEANGGFKCTLTFGPHRFVSKTCLSKKEAEHLAASMALQKLEGMVRQKQLTSMAAPSPPAGPSLPNLPDLLPSNPHSPPSYHQQHSLQSHAQQLTSVVQNQVPQQSAPAPLPHQSHFTERSLGRHTTSILPQHPSQMGSADQSTAGSYTHQSIPPDQSVMPAPQVHGPQHFTAPPPPLSATHTSHNHGAVVAQYPAAQVGTTQPQQQTSTPHHFVTPQPSLQQLGSVAHPLLQPTISHASASGPTPSVSQGLPPDPVTDLERLCTAQGWQAPQYQYWERQRTFHQVSVTCGPHEPFCISNGQYGTVDMARRMVAELALHTLCPPTHSPFISRGGPVSAAAQEQNSRTHQLERLCTEANLPQPQIEINQAVKEGYGTGVVALVTVGQERFISAVEADQHDACENALEKALAQLARSTSSHVESSAKQPGSATEDSADSASVAKQLRYKNDLQELLQKRGFPLPTYTCRETNGGFIATVSFVAARKGDTDRRQDLSLSEPQPTKKRAEQAVAKRALEWLSTNPQL